MASTKRVTLDLTTEQEETIKALFAHNNWDYIEVEPTPEKKRRCARQPLEPPQEIIPVHPDPVQNVPPQPIDGECEHCLQSPCVTSRQCIWLGQGQGPCIENSGIRRERYGRYWKVMSNLGAWNDPRYLQKKIQQANGGEWAVHHRREVMPVCILKQLRNIYPNPKDVPYMDHKWE